MAGWNAAVLFGDEGRWAEEKAGAQEECMPKIGDARIEAAEESAWKSRARPSSTTRRWPRRLFGRGRELWRWLGRASAQFETCFYRFYEAKKASD